MTPLQLLAPLVPGWVPWAAPGAVALWAAVVTLLGGLNGLWLRRQARGIPPEQHWALAARGLWELRPSFLRVPLLVGALCVVGLASVDGGLWRPWPPLWVALTAGLAAVAWSGWLSWRGFVAGLRSPLPPGWRRGVWPPLGMWLIMAPHLLVGLLAAPFLPELSWRLAASMILLGGAMVLALAGGGRWVASAIGALEPAPPELKAALSRVARTAGVHVKDVWVLDTPQANAFALPFSSEIVVTQPAAALLTTEEMVAVLAHELGHFQESAALKAARAAVAMGLVWLLAVTSPLLRAGRGDLWLGGLLFFVAMLVGVRYALRRAEAHADAASRRLLEDPTHLGHALEKLHQYNGVPAVLGRKHGHPDLYDRMLAAGVTPSFPRPPTPSPARSLWISAPTVAVALLVGGGLAALPLLLPSWDAAWGLGLRGGPQASVLLGRQRWEEGAPQEALVAFTAATQQAPEQPYTWLTLARGQLALGDCAGAVTSARALNQLDEAGVGVDAAWLEELSKETRACWEARSGGSSPP